MMIELVGGPHCGLRLSMVKLPPVHMSIHNTSDGQRWEAYYAPDGLRTQDGNYWRFTYTEQRKVIRPVSPPPVIPGPDGVR